MAYEMDREGKLNKVQTKKRSGSKTIVSKLDEVKLPSQTASAMMVKAGISEMQDEHNRNEIFENTWTRVEELRDEIRKWIDSMITDINHTVEMVKLYGCDHIAEFNIKVKTANEDLINFVKDFVKITEKHADYTGRVESDEELTLCLVVFENYVQFKAKFEGVMSHTMISFTEYLLEARDKAREKEQQEAEAKAAEEKVEEKVEEKPATKPTRSKRAKKEGSEQ